MQALLMLPENASLSVLIHREPYPLYEVLQSDGYHWQTSELADGHFAIIINRTL